MTDTDNPSLVLEPQALTEARQLAALLRDNPGDLTVRQALGWLHAARSLALSDGEDGPDRDAAVEAFVPLFLTGAGNIPQFLLLPLAVAVSEHATEFLDQALDSADPALLSSAIDLWQRMVHATPADHHALGGALSNLGVALQARFERTGDRADLDAAIAAGREAVQATPADHPYRAAYLSNLGLALRVRSWRTGDRVDLDAAIECFQAALRATPADDPDHARYLSHLGLALDIRFERTGDRADLDAAIECFRAAVRATPAGHIECPMHLSNLGKALRVRFERTGDQADLDAAITTGREAVQAASADHPDRALYLTNLGGTLRVRFEHTGDRADLEEAVDRFRTAVRALPAHHPDRAMALSNLGIALQARFRHIGKRADLDAAVAAGREAVRAASADHPDRALYLSNYGAALRIRFERSGDGADLDAAIAAGREAVRATPIGHRNRAKRLSNLGTALQFRFAQTGDRADLDEASDQLQAAVHAAPAHHPARAGSLSNLEGSLLRRFWRTGDGADLDAAVAAGREAVQAAPADHPDRALYLSNYGTALRIRFERSGDGMDLDEAIATVREAVRATPTDHPNHALYLANLGAALRDRFERSGDGADLDEAIATVREAVRTTPTDHPNHALYLANLGPALRERFEHSRDPADLDAAVSACSAAFEVVSAAPSLRIQAGWAAAALVAGSAAGRAADMAEAAVRLLPEVTPRQLRRGDQQYALGSFAGLASDAAALALADPRGCPQERATRALRLLEAGRAVLLSQALDARSDLTDLSQRHPELATRFVQLRDQLDQPADTATAVEDQDADAAGMHSDRTVRDQHRLARNFAQTLAEIRSLEGFASFASPPTTDELLVEATHGPVVVFNISHYRSDALLLTQDGITHLELRQITADSLTEKINAFHQALHTTTSGVSREQRRRAQEVLAVVLQWLWDTAAGPVLDVLGHHHQPSKEDDWPRVWWAPGGLLGLLPLHAAGYHTDPADDAHRRSVMDRVISSYTPTVRALRYARQHTRVPDAQNRGLVVAMPTTPGLFDHGRLHHVGAEAKLVHRHLPRTVLLREPDPTGPDGLSPHTPTKAAVLEHLRDCSIAHFACHGASDPTDPSQSLLLLHDYATDPLTVASLAPVHLDHAQLAYLSACRTAAIDTSDLADEAIHLTSAFQLAGFPHVVGTLWEIDDQASVTVADAFYTHLRTPAGTLDPDRAAWALHQAVRSLRDGHDLPGQYDRTQVPFLWAAYLHAGA
ncbi:CHAT domain-containing protein [Streptomyces sp. NPDC088810]|uniref:CHAT domain-containing tetratricopeptide repeat protein n=1 Tax=Streptomyces sp. NPDC088810 TaxID=3365904 RepID=UPI0038081983